MSAHNHHVDDYDAVCPACVEESAAETRASIVAWLRAMEDEAADEMAAAIERGDDLKEGGK